jgi:hypothetical protein
MIRRRVASSGGVSGATRMWNPSASARPCSVARSVGVNGEGETTSVATRPEVTIAKCLAGSATPRSSSAATASEASREVSFTAWGEYQREKVSTPSGSTRRRNWAHASRV